MTNRRLSKPGKNQGSILIFTMWILMLITSFSIAVGYAVRLRLEMVGRLEDREDLRRIAEAGVKKAAYVINHKRETKNQDTLNDTWSMSQADFKKIPIGNGFFSVSYETSGMVYYGMTDEESKINLNSTSSAEILTRLFELAAGLGHEEAHAIAVSILDWRDEDEHPYESGAESEYYQSLNPPYAAKNTNFNVLDELLFVKGITLEIYRRIFPYVTLDGSGKINLNTAPALVLKAIGFGGSLADKVASYRDGPDQAARTEDDRSFDNLATAADNLNAVNRLDEQERGSFQDFIGSGILVVNSAHFRVQSTGTLSHKDRAVSVVCVIERNGNVKRWFESFHTVQKRFEVP